MSMRTQRRRPAPATNHVNGRQRRHDHPVEAATAAMKRADDNLDFKDRDDPPEFWWESIEQAIDAMVEWSLSAPLTDLRFVHLCQHAAGMIDGYLEGLDATDEHGEPVTEPHVNLVRGMTGFLNAVPHQWPKVESIQQLDREKVPHNQIAAIHGLKPYEITEILTGKMKYPAGHVTPHEAEQRRLQKSARDTLRLAAARWKARRDIDAEFDAITAEDMLADGASLGEVSEYFDVEEDAVIDAAENAGFEPHDESDEESAAIESTIIDLHEGGQSNVAISEITGESIQRIASIVRIYQRSKAAGGQPAESSDSPQPPKRGRGRPRKSEQSEASKLAQKKRRAAKAAQR